MNTKKYKHRAENLISPDPGENVDLNCDLKTVVHDSQQMAMHREGTVNVLHSAFCLSECKRWNVISCAYPLLLQYNPMAPLSVCYSHTYWNMESREHLLRPFVQMQACLSSEWTSFWKKKPCPSKKVELKNVLRLHVYTKSISTSSSGRLIFKCMIYKEPDCMCVTSDCLILCFHYITGKYSNHVEVDTVPTQHQQLIINLLMFFIIFLNSFQTLVYA